MRASKALKSTPKPTSKPTSKLSTSKLSSNGNKKRQWEDNEGGQSERLKRPRRPNPLDEEDEDLSPTNDLESAQHESAQQQGIIDPQEISSGHNSAEEDEELDEYISKRNGASASIINGGPSQQRRDVCTLPHIT